MTNTIRKVTMVVTVLTVSCQPSLKPNNGPLTAQPTMSSTASANVNGRPVARATPFAKRPNQLALSGPTPVLAAIWVPVSREEGDVAVVRTAGGVVVAEVGHDADGHDVAGLLAERALVVLEHVATHRDPFAEAFFAAFHHDVTHPLGMRAGIDGVDRPPVQPDVEQRRERQSSHGQRLGHPQLGAIVEVELGRIAVERER